MILHIVVAVKYVVLPVVLVFGGDDNLAEPGAKFTARRHAEILPGIGVAAPGGVHFGQVVHRFPVALVNDAQDAGAVSARLAAKDAEQGGIAGGGSCRRGVRVGGAAFRILPEMLDDVVVVRRFVLLCRQRYCLVNQVDQVGESVAEKAADADGYINAGPAQLGQRHHFQTAYAPAFRLPHRLDAEQIEYLGNVVPVRPHCGSSPDHYAHHFRVAAFLVQVLLQQRIAQRLADIPRSGRGEGARVNRVKIAAGRQNIDHSARGGAGGSRRHETAFQAAQQVVNFIGSSQQRRVNVLANIRQDAGGAGVALAQQVGQCVGDQMLGKSVGAKPLVSAAA